MDSCNRSVLFPFLSRTKKQITITDINILFPFNIFPPFGFRLDSRGLLFLCVVLFSCVSPSHHTLSSRIDVLLRLCVCRLVGTCNSLDRDVQLA